MSARALRAVAAVGLAVLAGVIPARAQDARPSPPPPSRAPHASPGGWFGAGGGFLASRASCATCTENDDYTDGYGFLFGGGVAVNERFDGGAEVFTARSSTETVRYRTSYVLAVAQFRPWVQRGFFLKGGFGLVFFRGSLPGGGQPGGDVTSRGLGVHYGVGWIFRQDRRVSFAPFGGQYVATLGDVALPSSVAENVVGNSWLAGVVVLVR